MQYERILLRADLACRIVSTERPARKIGTYGVR